METRDFPSTVIASISTGFVLCEDGFSPMHEAAEYLMGHPVWTHQFADKQLCAEMRKTIAEQCPGMATREEAEAFGVNKDNWREFAARVVADAGPTVRIRKGSGLTAMLPTDGIPDHLKDKTEIIELKG